MTITLCSSIPNQLPVPQSPLIKSEFNQLENSIRNLAKNIIPLLEEVTPDIDFNVPFPFPEAHLTPETEKPLKSYTHIPLTPSDPLFSKINEILKTLKDKEKLTPSEEIIQNAYASYMHNVINSEGKERWRLLKGDAYMIAHFNNKLVCYAISQKLARTIASISKSNDNIKTPYWGLGMVTKVQDIFFKRSIKYSLSPGNAFLCNSFADLIVQGDPPPFQLVKICNIIVNSNKIELKRISHVFQTSPEVRGISLYTYLSNKSNYEISRETSLYSFTKGFILDLLCLPSDARSHNFQVTECIESGRKSIRAIDYDSKFHATPNSDMILTCATIRFFLQSLMCKPIDAKFKNDLINLDIESLLIEWITKADAYNAYHKHLIKLKVFTDEDFCLLNLEAILSKDALKYIYKTLCELQKLFKSNGDNVSHNEIFHHFHPTAAKIYKAIQNNKDYNALKAEDCIFIGHGGSTNILKLNNKIKMNLTDEELHSYKSQKHVDLPLIAFRDFLGDVFHKISDEQRIKLLHTIQKRVPEIIDYHLNDDNNRTSLHIAAFKGNIGLVHLYLLAGADPLMVDKNNETILHLSMFSHKSLAMVKFILEYLDVDKRNLILHMKNSDGEIPLHTSLYQDEVEIVKLLISSGSDPNARNNRGYTPLHLAARHQFTTAAKLLLEAGASTDIKCAMNETALSLANKWSAENLVQILTKQAALSNILEEHHDSPLVASSTQSTESLREKIKLLLEQENAEPNVELAQCYTRLAKIHYNNSEFNESIENQKKALGIYHQIHGDQPHAEVADCLVDLVEYLSRNKLDIDAIEYAEEILFIEQALLNPSRTILKFKCLIFLATRYEFYNQHKNSLEKYGMAYDLFKNHIEDVPNRSFAEFLEFFADYLDNTGNYIDSVKQMTFSIYIEKFFNSNPDNNSNINLGGNYNDIGVIFSDQGCYKSALKYALKARAASKVISMDTSTEIKILIYKFIAQCYLNLSRYNTAIKFYTKALKISNQIEGKDGSNSIMLQEKLDLLNMTVKSFQI